MNLKDAIENMLAADPNNPAEVRAAQSQLRKCVEPITALRDWSATLNNVATYDDDADDNDRAEFHAVQAQYERAVELFNGVES